MKQLNTNLSRGDVKASPNPPREPSRLVLLILGSSLAIVLILGLAVRLGVSQRYVVSLVSLILPLL